jgi:exosortase
VNGIETKVQSPGGFTQRSDSQPASFMMHESALELQPSAMDTDDVQEPLFYGFTAAAWVKITVVAVLMAATFRFNLLRLWLKTNPFSGEPNWRHAICVPLIGLYYLYVHSDELLATPIKTAWSGVAILMMGLLAFAYGIFPGQNDFIKDLGMVMALFGVVTLLCGWKVMRLAWFPIVFLVCALPWPELVYSKIASPLQHLAASVAVGILRLANVEAENHGTKILMNGKGNTWRTLNVAEACAGLRSLMTFISVAGAIAFLSARPLWQKMIVTFSAIPIAVFCNVMRVTGQGLLDHYWSQELSEGFAHQFVGIVMLVPGFFLIMLVGWLLDVIFVEVVDDRDERRKRAAIVKPVVQPTDWNLTRPALPAGASASATSGAGLRSVVKPAAVPTAPVATVTAPRTLTVPPTTLKPAPTKSPAASAPVAKPAPAGAPRPVVPGAVRPPAIRPPAVQLQNSPAAAPKRPVAAGAVAPVSAKPAAPAANQPSAKPPAPPVAKRPATAPVTISQQPSEGR